MSAPQTLSEALQRYQTAGAALMLAKLKGRGYGTEQLNMQVILREWGPLFRLFTRRRRRSRRRT